MTDHLDRRRFLLGVPLAAGVVATTNWAPPDLRSTQQTADVAAPDVDPDFPRQPAELVREVVRVAHFDVDRVRELVTARPALAKAAIDWGFGDWESALGAASHTGRREIAEVLLAHSARPTLFSATMLGQLDVVKGFVEAQPGVQQTLGPHSITLLAHARFGGEQAAHVLEYLEALGGADSRPGEAVAEEEQGVYLGTYAFGPRDDQRIRIYERRGGMFLERIGHIGRGLMKVGDREFYPAGAEAVRVRFRVENGLAVVLTVHDPEPIVVARRVASSGA